MVKVYVIYNDDTIHGVVSDEDLANEIIKASGYDFSYREFDLDSISIDTEYWFDIWFDFNGNVIGNKCKHYDVAFGNGFKIINDKCFICANDNNTIFVKAKNKKQAKEFARTMREKYLAERNN